MVLSERTLEEKWNFGLDVGSLKVYSDGLKCFSHFYCHIGKVGHLLLALYFFETGLRVNDFDLFSQGLLMRHDITICVPKLTLLNKAFSIELLGNPYTQFQMFADEVFKLLGSSLLALSIKQNTVVVPYDLID